MVKKIVLHNVGVSEVSEDRWKRAGKSMNRIHMPIKGRSAYNGAEGKSYLDEGAVYLMANSFATDLELLPESSYFHFFIDFATVPPLCGRELQRIPVDEDPVLTYLLMAAYGLAWEYTEKSGNVRVEKGETALFSRIERLLSLIV